MNTKTDDQTVLGTLQKLEKFKQEHQRIATPFWKRSNGILLVLGGLMVFLIILKNVWVSFSESSPTFLMYALSGLFYLVFFFLLDIFVRKQDSEKLTILEEAVRHTLGTITEVGPIDGFLATCAEDAREEIANTICYLYKEVLGLSVKHTTETIRRTIVERKQQMILIGREEIRYDTKVVTHTDY